MQHSYAVNEIEGIRSKGQTKYIGLNHVNVLPFFEGVSRRVDRKAKVNTDYLGSAFAGYVGKSSRTESHIQHELISQRFGRERGLLEEGLPRPVRSIGIDLSSGMFRPFETEVAGISIIRDKARDELTDGKLLPAGTCQGAGFPAAVCPADFFCLQLSLTFRAA